MPYMHALYVCLICMSYMYALHACLVCMPIHMHAHVLYLCMCALLIPPTNTFSLSLSLSFALSRSLSLSLSLSHSLSLPLPLSPSPSLPPSIGRTVPAALARDEVTDAVDPAELFEEDRCLLYICLSIDNLSHIYLCVISMCAYLSVLYLSFYL
jgi:hypothetical protein